MAKGQYKTAEDYLNRGIKADKGSAAMYRTMAEVKNRLGRHDEAMAVLRTGLENTRKKRPCGDSLGSSQCEHYRRTFRRGRKRV